MNSSCNCRLMFGKPLHATQGPFHDNYPPSPRDQSMRWGWGRLVSTATPPKPFAQAAARSANWNNHRRNPAAVPDQLTVPFPHQRDPSPALFTIQSASIIHQKLQLIQPAWAFLSHYGVADWNGFKLQQWMYGRTRGKTFCSEPAGQVNIYRGCQRESEREIKARIQGPVRFLLKSTVHCVISSVLYDSCLSDCTIWPKWDLEYKAQ